MWEKRGMMMSEASFCNTQSFRPRIRTSQNRKELGTKGGGMEIRLKIVLEISKMKRRKEEKKGNSEGMGSPCHVMSTSPSTDKSTLDRANLIQTPVTFCPRFYRFTKGLTGKDRGD